MKSSSVPILIHLLVAAAIYASPAVAAGVQIARAEDLGAIALARLHDGGAVVAWTHNERIFVRLLDDSGAPVGDRRRVWAGGLSVAHPESIAIASLDRGFVLVWTTADRLLFQRFDRDSKPLRPPTVASRACLVPTAPGISSRPGLGFEGFVITWVCRDGDAYGPLYARRFDSVGRSTSGDLLVEPGEPFDDVSQAGPLRAHPALAPDGSFKVAFDQQGGEASFGDIRLRTYEGLQAVGGSRALNGGLTASADQSGVRIAEGFALTSLAVWVDNATHPSGETTRGLRARRILRHGRPTGPQIVLDGSGDLYPEGADLAYIGGRSFEEARYLVVWSHAGLRWRTVAPSGLGPVSTLSTELVTQPRVVVLSAQRALVAWTVHRRGQDNFDTVLLTDTIELE